MSRDRDFEFPSILCHPDGSKSCGACCGMYNYRQHSADELHDALTVRTRAFHRDAVIEDPDSLEAFRARWEPTSGKLIDELPNCPFLGWVAPGRVGCLVHPSQNDGVDGRDCGVYDRATCDDYLCAAHQVLRPIEKWLVVAAVETSYTYGLVITDPLFVRQLFERTADINGASPSPGPVMRAEAVEAARGYFNLKAEWSYGASDAVFGQVRAGSGLETPRRESPSAALGVAEGDYDRVLQCLGTEVDGVEDLTAAREIVERAIRQFAEAVSR